VRALGIVGEAHAIVRGHAQGRIDARHDRTFADAHVEQDLRAERLDHFHDRIEGVIAGAAVGGMQRLGTQAEHHPLAGIAAQRFGFRRRHAHPHPGAIAHSAFSVHSSVTLMKFIAGEPMKPATKRLAGRW